MSAETETMEALSQRLGVRVEIDRDLGTQITDGWEHHAYVLAVYIGDASPIMTPWKQGLAIETSPSDTPAEVLNGLIVDASCVVDRDFDDYCDEFELNSDSRSAWKDFHAMKVNADVLRAVLGDDEFDHALYGVEGL